MKITIFEMDSIRLRLLSGAEIVAKGRNVTDCMLPETGTKEVSPNGSWLEQKQIQAALEARKDLVAVERIDKVGSLSHAEWQDEQRLAVVTQQVGGHWQYVGHQVNGIVYLLPEEALYLMETNCLLLKHNNVTVSLQKAYSLLLNNEMSLIQYRVYASLSRVGYKVFRHQQLYISPKKAKSNNVKLDLSDADIDMSNNASNEESAEQLDNTLTGNSTIELHTISDISHNISHEETTEQLGKTLSGDSTVNVPGPVDLHTISLHDEVMKDVDDISHNTSHEETTEQLGKTLSGDSTVNVPGPVDLHTISLHDEVMKDADDISHNTSHEETTEQLGKTLSGDSTVNVPGPVDLHKIDLPDEAIADTNMPHNASNEASTEQSDKTLLGESTNVPAPGDLHTINLPDEVMNDPATLCKESSSVPIEQPEIVSIDNSRQKYFENNMTEISACISSLHAKQIFSVDEHGNIRLATEDQLIENDQDVLATTQNKMETDGGSSSESNSKDLRLNSYLVKSHKIKNRKVKSSDPQSMLEILISIPDLYKKNIVTVTVPSEEYLPRNVFLNNTSYELNLFNLESQVKACHKSQSCTRPTGTRAMYKAIKNSNESESAAVPTPEPPQHLPNTPSYQQPYGAFMYRRPHMQYQRPFYPQHRFNQHPYFYRMMNFRPPFFPNRPLPPFNMNQHQQQKVKEDHLQAIKNIAQALRQTPSNIDLKLSLINLLKKYNHIYRERMNITAEFYIVNLKQTIETIEIADDEVEENKTQSNKFDQYLATMKQLAVRLKNLIRKNQPIAKQTRSFCNLLKHFNKEYNTELCLGENGELIDKKLVILDSSDSDVSAVDEPEMNVSKKRKSQTNKCGVKNKKRKMLVNPFSVIVNACSSRIVTGNSNETSSNLEKYFDKNWLPNDDDFGKPVLCSKLDAQHLINDSRQLYDFMEEQRDSVESWVDLKLKFYTYMEAVSAFEHDLTDSRNFATKSRNIATNSRLKPIFQGSVSDSWSSALEKLRIIKTNLDSEETHFRVNFDVYNRDVQKFRKTDPPKPHFRIVCINESSNFPSTAEVRALHSRLDDNVTLVFAVVGVGSITYLQVNPTDLPVYNGND